MLYYGIGSFSNGRPQHNRATVNERLPNWSARIARFAAPVLMRPFEVSDVTLFVYDSLPEPLGIEAISSWPGFAEVQFGQILRAEVSTPCKSALRTFEVQEAEHPSQARHQMLVVLSPDVFERKLATELLRVVTRKQSGRPDRQKSGFGGRAHQ